jgi:hypothetical protein
MLAPKRQASTNVNRPTSGQIGILDMSDAETARGNQQYFIRVRGKVLGPFTLEKLKALRARGQFSRIHEVSTNRQDWQPASTLDAVLGLSRPVAAIAESERGLAQIPDKQARSSEGSAASMPGANWYYNVVGEQRGPVSIMELRSMVTAGKLRPDDFVWKDGMSDWLPTSQVPELQPSAPASSGFPNPAYPEGYVASPGDGIHHTSGLAVASLILGILGLIAPCIGLLFSLMAVIFGAAALKAIGKSRVNLGGRGMALSGLVMGTIGLALWGLFILYYFGTLAAIGINAPRWR